jgi:hypothetical protein
LLRSFDPGSGLDQDRYQGLAVLNPNFVLPYQ